MARPAAHPVQAVAVVVVSHVDHVEADGGVHMRIRYDRDDSFGTIISKAQELLGLGPYRRMQDGTPCISMVATEVLVKAQWC